MPDGDAARFVAANLWSAPHRYEARLTLYASAGQLARTQRFGGTVTPLGPDRCEFRTADDSLDWLSARIGLIGVAFDVHEPPELVDHLAHLATRFAVATRRPVSTDLR